ncbi:hypothetical protein [Endozoicomonas arenosclerae]|uniref:hypothetical protein n=1 Tax=Endozoicomonas arenosclerae TaxID=1633495 RepID=UPI000786168C|nr:hypothetical protein [Endozoicomonas arenosclerae]
MRFEISGHTGSLPAVDAARLPANAASIAENCRVDKGVLQSARGLKDYRDLSLGDVKTVYRYGALPGDIESGHIFEWSEVVDCVAAPLPEDVSDTVLILGDGEPKITHNGLALGSGRKPSNSYRLGVPQPGSAIVVNVSGNFDDGAREFNRDYMVTFVCQVGALVMEGKPSNPSIPVTMRTGQTCQLTGIVQPPAGNYNFVGKRLYRRSNYSGPGSWQLVAQLANTVDSFTDNLEDTEIPGSLPDQSVFDADMPNSQLFAATALPNGITAYTDGDAVYYGFPYRPHAVGAFNRTPIKHCVGLGHFENIIVALTAENPVIITGDSPAGMYPDEITNSQGCLSRRSIVSGPFGVAYASPDGLSVVTGAGADVATTDVIDRDSWQELNPSSIAGVLWEGSYMGAFTRTNGSRGVFLFDPRNRSQGILFYDLEVDALHADGLSDTVFVVSDGKVKLWDRGEALQFRWRSGVSITDPIKLSTCRIKFDGTFRLRLWRDGIKVFDAPVTNRAFRLPAGRGERWQYELEGIGTIYSVVLASSMQEV